MKALLSYSGIRNSRYILVLHWLERRLAIELVVRHIRIVSVVDRVNLRLLLRVTVELLVRNGIIKELRLVESWVLIPVRGIYIRILRNAGDVGGVVQKSSVDLIPIFCDFEQDLRTNTIVLSCLNAIIIIQTHSDRRHTCFIKILRDATYFFYQHARLLPILNATLSANIEGFITLEWSQRICSSQNTQCQFRSHHQQTIIRRHTSFLD